MSKPRTTLTQVLLTFLLLAMAAMALVVWLFGFSDFGLSEAMVHRHPEHPYRIVLLRRYWWGIIPMAPGSGSDAPGVARLLDAEGNIIEEAELDMLQIGYDVTWEARQVLIANGLVARWPLPPAVQF